MEALAPDKQQILERERRRGKPVAFSAIAALVLYVASGAIVSLADLINRDNKATEVASFHEHSSELLGVAALTALGSLLLIPPLYFMFRAAQARNPAVKGALLPFVFIGPALLAVQSILSWAANTSVANEYVDQVGTRTGQAATDFAQKLLDDSSIIQAAGGIAIPAVLGMIIVMMYVSLMAMRTGLLSRFWGTFGMAFGVGVLILGLIGVMIWILYVGLLAAGWLTRPPAWEAVEAIPWPSGGMRTQPGPGSTVEGSGREIDVGDSDGVGGAGDDAGGGAGEPGALPSGEPPGTAPRKRKRRD